MDGLRVEIVEQRSQWRSGSITLGPNGVFMTEIHAEKGRKCEYEIILTDATGRRLSCSSDRFAYTVGNENLILPLTHNLGVAKVDNKADWLFKKGDPLPARANKDFYTTVPLRKNEPYHETNNVIRIPLIEGANMKADRNRPVRAIEIKPDDPRVRRDVPLGATVEVTISLDVSGTSTIEAFIPILDEVFSEKCNLKTELRSPEQLAQELTSELTRLRELEQRASATADARVAAVLEKVERQQITPIVERQVAAAQCDPDAQGEAGRGLLDLKAAADSVEDALEWPSLVREAHEQVEATRQVVDSHGHPSEV